MTGKSIPPTSIHPYRRGKLSRKNDDARNDRELEALISHHERQEQRKK